MSTSRGDPPWWAPFYERATRQEAWKLAQAINSEQGGVRELDVERAERYGLQVTTAGEHGADLEHLEVLTGADGGNVRPPPGPVPEQDPPEVKAAVENARRERLKREVTSKVNAALAERRMEMEAAAAAGESSTATTPPAPPTTPAAAEPGETLQPELPTMQHDVPTPSPVLSGRRVRADSISHIRERTAQRCESFLPANNVNASSRSQIIQIFKTSSSNTNTSLASAPPTPTVEAESSQSTGTS